MVISLVCLSDFSDAELMWPQGLLEKELSFLTELLPLSNDQRWGRRGQDLVMPGVWSLWCLRGLEEVMDLRGDGLVGLEGLGSAR